jgi:tyrosine-protein kinase Etk/Wzc
MTGRLEPDASAAGPLTRADDRPSLLDYAAVVWCYRWLISGTCLVTVLTVFVITVTGPKIYESTTTLLAPKESGPSGLLGGLVATGLLQQPSGLSMPSLTQNREILVSILKSRTVATAVATRFQLQERYRALHLEDAVEALRRLTEVRASFREGLISVKVEDTDPQVAAAIANFYVDQLDHLVAQLGVSEAGRQRVFLTEQLARAKGQLEGAEKALRRFEEQNRAVVLQDQTRAAIDAAARLKAEMMAAEVQLQVIRNFATEANPDTVMLRRRIEEMKRQLAQMQYGEDGKGRQGTSVDGGSRRDFYVPPARVPEVGLELTRLIRDVKVQETLMTLLTQQVEQVKIAEARDMPMVQVLDRAVPAIYPSKPRLWVNLALAAAGSLLAGLCLAFFLRHIGDLRRKPRTA